MGVTNPHMDAKWLKDELAKPGRSQSELARFLGLEHPSIVNRMCKGDRQIKAFEADRIREYLDATKDPTTRRGSDVTLPHIAPRPSPTALLPVKGTVGAGNFREVPLSDVDYEGETLFAPRWLVDSGAYALRVIGPSMDKLYPDGSYVVVQPWVGGPLPFGKKVIVERSRDGFYEATIKELMRGADGEAELWPRSDHPEHQTPIPYKAEYTHLRIVGVVIWSMKPE